MSSDPGQFFKGLIGQSDAQVAARDTDKYTGPGSKVKRTGGEVLSDFIFRFGNTDGLQKAAEDIYVDKLQDDYGRKLESIDDKVRKDLGLIDRLGITKDMSVADVARMVKKGEKLETARDTAKATDGIKPEDYAGTDAATITRNTNRAAKNTARADIYNDPYFKQQEDRFALQNNLQMLQMRNDSADRTSQRRMDNRRIDLQEARDARKGQREMMMMIMAGLQNIGQGFN
jgi:hypothetical protein